MFFKLQLPNIVSEINLMATFCYQKIIPLAHPLGILYSRQFYSFCATKRVFEATATKLHIRDKIQKLFLLPENHPLSALPGGSLFLTFFTVIVLPIVFLKLQL